MGEVFKPEDFIGYLPDDFDWEGKDPMIFQLAFHVELRAEVQGRDVKKTTNIVELMDECTRISPEYELLRYMKDGGFQHQDINLPNEEINLAQVCRVGLATGWRMPDTIPSTIQLRFNRDINKTEYPVVPFRVDVAGCMKMYRIGYEIPKGLWLTLCDDDIDEVKEDELTDDDYDSLHIMA